MIEFLIVVIVILAFPYVIGFVGAFLADMRKPKIKKKDGVCPFGLKEGEHLHYLEADRTFFEVNEALHFDTKEGADKFMQEHIMPLLAMHAAAKDKKDVN